jgi:hypothetical protein
MAYVDRSATHVAPGDLLTAADYNQGMDNEAYLYINSLDKAGWIEDAATWTRTADTTFTVTGDRTATFRKGTKIRYKQGGAFKYGYVAGSTFGAVTTVTITGGSDYAMVAGNPTDTAYSYIENPEAFPQWFTWLPTITGYSTVPPAGWAAYRFRVSGNTVFLMMNENSDGAHAGISNATTKTYTLPIAAKTSTNAYWSAVNVAYQDNAALGYSGCLLIASAATTMNVFKASLGNWTNSGNCSCFYAYGAQASYEF